MNGWPQCFPHLGAGSQFGPRTFKGNPSFHWGRDQPAGVGSVRRAPAAGVVLAHGRTETYGHYIVVLYDGATIPESMHQVQARDRWPVGQRFAAGDPLAKVGHPHLWLPEAARRRMADWSGGSKASSTGSHSHQQNWRDRFGGTAIDPAGAECAADWARVIRTQTRPAGGSTTPIVPKGFLMALTDQQQDELYNWVKSTAHHAEQTRNIVGGKVGDTGLVNRLRGVLAAIGTVSEQLVGIARDTDGTRKIVGGSTADKNGDGKQDEPGIINRLRSISAALTGIDGITIDEAALAAELAPLLDPRRLSDEEVERLARAAADEADRRMRERLDG